MSGRARTTSFADVSGNGGRTSQPAGGAAGNNLSGVRISSKFLRVALREIMTAMNIVRYAFTPQ